MANMSPTKNPIPEQDPNVRNKNFLEVALGYTEEQALDEAARCLNCKNHPCVDGCPVNVRIPEFIQKIVEKDYEGTVKFLTVDIDQNPELAQQFRVEAVPTIVFLSPDGREQQRFTGAPDEATFRQAVDALLRK